MMPYVRLPNHAVAAPPRPRIVLPKPIVPRALPVLQPPPFYQQQYTTETHEQPSTINNINENNNTQSITVHYPTYIPQQNYPNKPISNRSIRPVRSAEPKYPTKFRLNQ